MAKEEPSARKPVVTSRPSASKEKSKGVFKGDSRRGVEVKQERKPAAAQEPERPWVMFDARGLVVGRLASEVARLLRGKDNPAFLPNRDSGRGVVVVNTDHLHFTGNKRQQKLYYRHTGYPGGIKSRSVKELFEKNRSTDILRSAVKGMLPRGVLGRAQLKKLRLFRDEEHRQGAQQPKMINFAALSAKNSKR